MRVGGGGGGGGIQEKSRLEEWEPGVMGTERHEQRKQAVECFYRGQG